jgi:dCTP deaminase
MSVLSDTTIERYALYGLITPFSRDQLQPASYDVLLGQLPNTTNKTKTIMPGEFMLASTVEYVNLPANIVGRIEGKSSLARKGLIIHTAGFVDPGFRGQLTLEITNLSQNDLTLKVGDRIAQIAFSFLDEAAARPYGTPGLGSHYQDQVGIVNSKL